jgi:hypothetical protein
VHRLQPSAKLAVSPAEAPPGYEIRNRTGQVQYLVNPSHIEVHLPNSSADQTLIVFIHFEERRTIPSRKSDLL